MTTIVEREARLNKGDFDPIAKALGAVEDFIKSNRAIVDEGVVLRLALAMPTSKKRTTSLLNLQILRKLMTREDAVRVYFAGEAEFNFGKEEYSYKGRAIHLTPLEQISLYRFLVLNVRNMQHWPRIRHCLRKKFGGEFLEGII